MLKIIDVYPAQLDNFQVMEELFRTVFAELQFRTVIKEDKSNLVNKHVIDANLAYHQLSCVLVEISVKYQDQHATATNNTEQQTTLVKDAQLDNCQETVATSKMVFVE